jgi:class 3 adenylate cyclase
MDAPETCYARSGELFIGYQVWGRGGPDLLELSHAANFSIDETWNEARWLRYERRLASFTRLIRFDPRGIGLSDTGSSGVEQSLRAWADDAVAVLDAVGTQQVAVIAGSLGSVVSIYLAAHYPERVSSLILINGSARLVEAPDYPIGLPAEYAAAIAENAQPGSDARDQSDDIALIAPSLVADDTFRRWWARATRRSATPSVAQAINAGVLVADVRDLLAQVRVPTLVIHRRDSPVVAQSRYLAEHIKNARVVEVAGSDPLAFAGDAESVLSEVEEFLTGKRLGAQAERVFAAVLFTDIVGSTALAAELGDQRFKLRLEELNRIAREAIDRYGGRFVKDTGDGALATFDRPTQAVHCALAMHQGAAEAGLSIRAGIHAGEIELRGDDVGGIAVHTAARICALSDADEILVSSTFTDLVSGSGTQFRDRGTHELKGIPGPRHLLAVVA